MKANEAPEKIYIVIDPVWGSMSVNYNRNDTDNIEYSRTDTFIEKALEFLDGCIPDYIDLKHANVDTFMNIDNKRFIEDFKKYMEEE